jgi:hypothetical protein
VILCGQEARQATVIEPDVASMATALSIESPNHLDWPSGGQEAFNKSAWKDGT